MDTQLQYLLMAKQVVEKHILWLENNKIFNNKSLNQIKTMV